MRLISISATVDSRRFRFVITTSFTATANAFVGDLLALNYVGYRLLGLIFGRAKRRLTFETSFPQTWSAISPHM